MLNHLGEHAQLRGDFNAAAAIHQEALKIAYETGNRNREMAFLSNLGGARVGLEEYRVAEYDLRRIIRWAEIAGQGGWLSSTYRFLAEACLGQDKVGESLAAARRALVMGKKVGSPDLIGRAWRTLGCSGLLCREHTELCRHGCRGGTSAHIASVGEARDGMGRSNARGGNVARGTGSLCTIRNGVGGGEDD